MSNFVVGDRVVVTSEDTMFFLQRGEVSNLKDDSDFSVRVELDGDRLRSFMPEELELEGVYNILGEMPVEPEVDSRSEDVINHPSHYADGWSNGAEVIDITEHLNFNRGNAVKYLSRAGKKGGSEKELEDLQKALWYVTREVERLGGTV